MDFIKKMIDEEYVKLGETKAVMINYNVLYLTTDIYVSVHMLVEFATNGQVIPTRFDVLPFRLNAFASH